MLIANYAQQLHTHARTEIQSNAEQAAFRSVLEDEIKVYQQISHALIYGDDVLQLAPNHVSKIRTHLLGINDQVEDYIQNGMQLLQNPTKTEYVHEITGSAMALKNEFDLATNLYQQVNDAMIARQRLIDIVLISFAFFITIFGIFLTGKIRNAEKDLQGAKRTAEEKSKAKSEFLANMSHEIRTPLTGVIGFTELLKVTQLNGNQQQYVNNINMAGHTLLKIINDILDFSKIEADMLELNPVKANMPELLDDSIDIVKFAAASKGLELLLNIDHILPNFAHVDPVRLKQILVNLLSNAVKFTEKGEVELNVDFKWQEEGMGRFLFSVRDTGIGISDSEKEKLFKAFSQADSSTTRKFGGTGLGLIISEKIAWRMGSNILMRSTPGEGSTFFFEIVVPAEEGESYGRPRIEQVKRCLIVDKNRSNCRILERMLRKWQIESEICDNGFDALKRLHNYGPFDLMICAYELPYMDGIELIRKTQEKLNRSQKTLPAILLYSPTTDAELYKKCEEAGVRFHLSKPVKRKDLFDAFCKLNQTGELISENKNNQQKESWRQKTITEKAKILIAEDVPMNMLLIKKIIENLIPKAEFLEAKMVFRLLNFLKPINLIWY